MHNLTLFTGPMCSEKSYYLLEESKKYTTPIFLSSISETITTRKTGAKFSCLSLQNDDNGLTRLLQALSSQETKDYAFFIDEAQFLPASNQGLFKKLRSYGPIYVSALDLTYKGEPFPFTDFLKKEATVIHVLKSQCACGRPAEVSQRLRNGQPATHEEGPLIALDAVHGGHNPYTYEPRCFQCFQ